MPSSEEWRPVVGWEGLYEVSSHGRVRSLDRRVGSRWGKTRLVPGTVLNHYKDLDGYPCVTLSRTRDGKRDKSNYKVSRLVAQAYLPDAPTNEHYNVLHWDDVKEHNHVSNLRWGTRQDNSQDIIRNGNNPRLNRSTCLKGHEYDERNTYLRPTGARECRICIRVRKRAKRD